MSLRLKYVPLLPLVVVALLLLLAPAALLAAESEAALEAASTCSGGECAGAGEEEEEAAMPTESSRRALAATRYVSYDALKKDRVPCSQRGRSYYNCQQHGKANPYRRGCTVITRCARMLN